MPHFPEEMDSQTLALRSAVETENKIATSEDNNTYRIRVKNRRKRYLDTHPDYFKSADLELAGRA